MALSFQEIEVLRKRVKIGMTGARVFAAIGEPYRTLFSPRPEMHYRTSEYQLTLFQDKDYRVIDIQVRPLTLEEQAEWQAQYRTLEDDERELKRWLEKRAEIDRLIQASPHPRREGAVFTDDNDHNPIILQDCPECHGRRKFCEWGTPEDRFIHQQVVCLTCCGLGSTGTEGSYFANDTPAIDARLMGISRILCPHCGETFRIHDSSAWTGRRHRTCGQKITARYDLPSLPDERTQHPWGETLCTACGKRLAAWGDTARDCCGYCRHPLPARPEEDPTPADALLTMQEAADILDVSHAFLVGLLEAEKIPYQRLGDRRRILFQDVIAFKAKMEAARADAMRQLTEEAQELDMGC